MFNKNILTGRGYNLLVALAGTVSAACRSWAAITVPQLAVASPTHCRCGFTRASAPSDHLAAALQAACGLHGATTR